MQLNEEVELLRKTVEKYESKELENLEFIQTYLKTQNTQVDLRHVEENEYRINNKKAKIYRVDSDVVVKTGNRLMSAG